MSYWLKLHVSKLASHFQQRYLICLKGCYDFHLLKPKLLSTIKVMLRGKRDRVGCPGLLGRPVPGWDLGFIGWKGSWQSCKGLRTWMRESIFKLPTSTLERSAAIQHWLPACTNTAVSKGRLNIQVINGHSWFQQIHKHYTQCTQKHTLDFFYLLVGEMKLASNWSWGRLAGWAEQRQSQTNIRRQGGRKSRATAPKIGRQPQ